MASDFTQKIFALNGAKKPISTVPDGSSMSYAEGFNPLTGVDYSAGGIALEREQWNTLNYEMSELLAEIQTYGCPLWCSTRTTPYPVGTLVAWVVLGIVYQFRCRNPLNVGVTPGSNSDVWLNVTYFAPYPTSSADLQIGDILTSPFSEEYALSFHSNFLAPKGQTLSRTGDFSELYRIALSAGRVIPQADWEADPLKRGAFGDGDGVNTFVVPDLQGYFIRSSEATTAPFGFMQNSQNLSHSHAINGFGFKEEDEGFEGSSGGKIGNKTNLSAGNSGGSEARPINVAYTFLMKYK